MLTQKNRIVFALTIALSLIAIPLRAKTAIAATEYVTYCKSVGFSVRFQRTSLYQTVPI